ncbi:hypothetical protein [Ectobacillus sp. sgz5001026]
MIILIVTKNEPEENEICRDWLPLLEKICFDGHQSGHLVPAF